MKKYLLVALVAVGMAACVQNEELGVANNKEAISFDPFVENATKASMHTTGNLELFKVYGTISKNGAVVTNIFDGVEVSNETGVWAYDPQYTQYWVPGFTYDFAAVVDATVAQDANGMPKTLSTNLQEQKDVLYATVSDKEYNGGQAEKVSFQFAHLLSKAKFTVKNTIENGQGFVYNVESIKIKNADWNGAYDVATGVWAADDTYCADFGVAATLAMGSQPVSGSEVYLLPSANKDLDIEVVYNLTYNGATLKSETKTIAAVLTLEKGTAYNFVVVFGEPGEEIKFEAIVNDWANGSVEVFQGVSVPVTTAQELIEAIADPEVGEAVLMNDIDLTSTITRSGEESTPIIAKSFVIDGNGKTLNYSGSNRVIDITYKDGENDNLVVTIKDLTINITSTYCQRGINYNAGGLLIIDNVKFEGTAPTYAVNCPAYSDNAVVKIKDSEVKGNIALNLWGSDMKVDVTDSHLISVDNTEVENYAAISLNSDGDTNIAEGTVVNIEGGKVIARDEKGEPACAVRNSTATGCVNISETTEVVGGRTESVAMIYYNGYSEFYSTTSLQGAIDKAIETNASGVRVLRDLELLQPLTIAKGKSVYLDLNCKTVKGLDKMQTGGYALITNQGNLTVAGPGKLVVEAEYDRDWNAYSSVISNQPGGNLVVDGGVVIEHLGGTDMAYGIDNLTNGKGTSAVTTIKNATVKSTYRAVRQFLNGIEATNELHVKAGAVVEGANKSIWMQDPSANANTGKLVVEAGAQIKGDVYLYVCAGSTTWPVEVSIASAALVGESKVMTGNVPAQYEVVEVDGVWTVIEQLVAATTADLQTALAEGKNVILASNITVETTEMLTAPYGNKMAFSHNGGVFNGNGKAISVKANGDNYVVMTNGGTIKNLDIDRGFRGVVLMYPTQDVHVDNVKIGVNDEVCYTINTAEGEGTHSLYVSNSVLNGWCSIGTAVKAVTFTNCTFGQGTYYTDVWGRLVKPYVDAVFDGCDFCSKCYLDLSAFVGTKVVVKNCTVNGVKLTAENWTSLVAPEATCEDGQISVELKNGSYLTAENVVDYIVFE